MGALAATYGPQGYNLGWNLGRIAGAGVVDHVHLHVVPRWAGDTNFMPVLADVKVLPEHPRRDATPSSRKPGPPERNGGAESVLGAPAAAPLAGDQLENAEARDVARRLRGPRLSLRRPPWETATEDLLAVDVQPDDLRRHPDATSVLALDADELVRVALCCLDAHEEQVADPCSTHGRSRADERRPSVPSWLVVPFQDAEISVFAAGRNVKS